MEFKEWLKNEVAKARPKNIDISNLAIGRIGPMGTFGQETGQSIPAWATASTLGSMGKSLRQKLGSLGSDPAHQLLPLASLKDVYRDGMELPLQIPVLNGKEIFTIARSSDKLVFSSILSNLKSPTGSTNPAENTNVRKFGEINPEMPGKFELVNQTDQDQGKVEKAKKFTEGLIKVMMLYKMMSMKTKMGKSLADIYDINNPQVSSRYYKNNHLGIMLSYKRLEYSPEGEENDYTQTQEIPQDNAQVEKGEK